MGHFLSILLFCFIRAHRYHLFRASRPASRPSACQRISSHSQAQGQLHSIRTKKDGILSPHFQGITWHGYTVARIGCTVFLFGLFSTTSFVYDAMLYWLQLRFGRAKPTRRVLDALFFRWFLTEIQYSLISNNEFP